MQPERLIGDLFEFRSYTENGRMITEQQELQITSERITRFQRQIAVLRQAETNPANYRASVAGFLAEIDRMQLEIRDFLSLHPTELDAAIERV